MIKENRRLWKLILLTIFTFGIYNIVFWFQLTRDLNEMNREEKKLKNYILVLFLSLITFGIYRWVWFFYVADRIQVTGESMGMRIKPGPGTTLFVRLFGTFILIGPLVSNFMVIRNMNKIAKEYNRSFKKKTTVVNHSDMTSEKKTISGKNSAATSKREAAATKSSTTASKKSATPVKSSTTTSKKSSTPVKSSTTASKKSSTPAKNSTTASKKSVAPAKNSTTTSRKE